MEKKNPINENSIENNLSEIYEKIENNPRIKEAIVKKIEELASKIDDIKYNNPEDIYNSFYDGEYSDKPEQLAKVFSLVFRKYRDNDDRIRENGGENFIKIKLKNSNSTLNVRNSENKVFSKLRDGMTLKDLGKTKFFNGLEYSFVEFFGSDGKIVRGYIAKKYTTEVKDKSLKQLDGYIRSIGLNPTREFKEEVLKRVYLFSSYRGDIDISRARSYHEKKEIQARISRDNNEVYHKLVQDFELRKLIEVEEILSENEGEIQRIKSLEGLQRELELNQFRKKVIINEFRKKTKKIEKNNTLSNNIILNRIKNDSIIIEYLERNFYGNAFEERFNSFKTFNGFSGNDIKTNAMIFSYLFQHSRGFQLGDYYKLVTGKEFSSLGFFGEKVLFKRYTGEVNQNYNPRKMSNRLVILRGLIIEHELGIDILNELNDKKYENRDYNNIGTEFERNFKREKLDEFFYNKSGLNIKKIKGHKAEYRDKILEGKTVKMSYCAKTRRLNLGTFGISAERGNAIDIYKRDKSEVYYDLDSLKIELVNKIKNNGSNVFDIVVEKPIPKSRKNKPKQITDYHSLLVILGNDGEFYVMDPYRTGTSNPYPLSNYNFLKKGGLKIKINNSFKTNKYV